MIEKFVAEKNDNRIQEMHQEINFLKIKNMELTDQLNELKATLNENQRLNFAQEYFMKHDPIVIFFSDYSGQLLDASDLKIHK